MIHVLIVDDHQIVIEGLKLLLSNEPDIKVIASVNSGELALKLIDDLVPDVVLLDINLPGINGIETCAELLKKLPSLKIVAITMHKESSLIKLMLQKGAKGYVLKNAGRNELIEAINTVYNGKMYLDNTTNEIVLNGLSNNSKSKDHSPFPKLSRREKDVLLLILDEHTTQEIADKLFISAGTVETHRRNMLIKTGARNTAGLVRIALEYGLNK